jgi:hypothetical protein
MGVLAADTALVAIHALVGDGRHHAGRLADDAGQRRNADVAQVGDQFPRAKTADLLVIAERQVDRERCAALEKIVRMGQGDRDEALHVGRASAVELAVTDRTVQRIARPLLAIPRDGIGMT